LALPRRAVLRIGSCRCWRQFCLEKRGGPSGLFESMTLLP
jgi:hypothetical protein